MTNPLDSGFQAGPQSPFQAAPVVPLFVRDRYGSDDSVSTIHSIEPKPVDDNANPWAAEGEQMQEKEVPEKTELPPTDRGWKAWSILAGAFVFEALIWGMLSTARAGLQVINAHFPQAFPSPTVSFNPTIPPLSTRPSNPLPTSPSSGSHQQASSSSARR